LELKCARDFKGGGYNLEGTNVTGERLVVMVLLIAIAYTTATIQGRKMKQMGIQKYRSCERGRTNFATAQQFYIGLYGQTWVNFMDGCADVVAELMKLNRNKREYYQGSEGYGAYLVCVIASFVAAPEKKIHFVIFK